MKNLEIPHNKLDAPEHMERFLDAYSEALEEMVTAPRAPFNNEELGQVERFKEGQKLPKANKWFYDKFVRAAQDFRFSPDEIDILSDRYFA